MFIFLCQGVKAFNVMGLNFSTEKFFTYINTLSSNLLD